MKSYTALVEAVLMTSQPGSFVTRRKDSIEVDLGGIPNDRHYGLLRPADSRQKIYPAGTPIANRRQLSLVSAEECERIARNLGVLYILPEWLGANVLLSGYPELTGLPQGARILFQSGAGIIGEGENLPCMGPARIIAESLEQPELKTKFIAAAKKARGIVASVELPGSIRVGDTVQIYL